MSLWKHRDFMLLWGGKTLYELGEAVGLLAIPLLAVTVLNASTLEVAILSALGMAAYLVVALPAGVWLDRVRKRGVMIACNLFRAGLFATVAIAAWSGQVTMAHLWVVMLLSSASVVVYELAHQAYLPSVVGADQLLDANGKLTATYSVAHISGFGLGGGIIALTGVVRAIGLDAIGYLINAGSLLLIRRPEATPQAPPRRNFRRELVAGLSYVFSHPVLPRIVAATATFNLFSQMIYALSIVFLVRTLHLAEGLVALTLALTTIGGIAGGMASGWLARRIGTARIIWASVLGLGWTMFLVPLAQPGWGVISYAVGMAGFAALCAIYNSAQISYRQRICPPELLGRMTASVRWVVLGVMPIGALAGGALGTWLGVRETMWIAAAGVWASGLWVYFSPLRHLRDSIIEEPPKAAVS